ncbi:MarR family winged helix-turn-helix transcriptional regulator [Moraxella sp. ZY210820]|uniref:MarR family winged helix-turn-helix transcriptional regulator n=1 Tax=unclassified Moraxella TaxID=2685852 RepID=UPI00272F082B|nr:MarR family transcriptional regulator [Moraxella sp. ZY210820]WLF83360.1 MarR family transcriptional regulator [Moraxella sp. ZY210820]
MSNTPKNPLDQLGDISTKIVASYAIFAKKYGISDNELAIFYALWVNECRTQKQIADEYVLAKQTINTLCKRFEADGLITSIISQNDKREKILSLTDKGKAFAKPIIEPLLNLEQQIIDEFGNERMLLLLKEMQNLQTLMANHLES